MFTFSGLSLGCVNERRVSTISSLHSWAYRSAQYLTMSSRWGKSSNLNMLWTTLKMSSVLILLPTSHFNFHFIYRSPFFLTPQLFVSPLTKVKKKELSSVMFMSDMISDDLEKQPRPEPPNYCKANKFFLDHQTIESWSWSLKIYFIIQKSIWTETVFELHTWQNEN